MKASKHELISATEPSLFYLAALRLRYELRGVGVTGEDLGSGQFALRAGDHQLVIHTLPSSFAGQKVVWRMKESENLVFIDAICYRGAERDFDFGNPLQIQLAAGVELLSVNNPPSESPLWVKRESCGQGTWRLRKIETASPA